MNLFHGIIFVLYFLCFLVDFESGFYVGDGESIYSYDKSDLIGMGAYGYVYKGNRTEGSITDDVAIKVAKSKTYNLHIQHEKDIYEVLSAREHDSIPKFYKYFAESNDSTEVILVTELLGENMEDLSSGKIFSVVTSMRIGLQVLDALEHMHKQNIIHFDLHTGNVALGYHNDSRIYLLDFNVAQVYQVINESIVLNNVSLHEEYYVSKGMSPRYDIRQLVDMLLDFLGAHILDYPHHMPKEYNEVVKRQKIIQLIEEFGRKNGKSESIYPDYEALRDIMKCELEKHKKEPNFDKFDWQLENNMLDNN